MVLFRGRERGTVFEFVSVEHGRLFPDSEGIWETMA